MERSKQTFINRKKDGVLKSPSAHTGELQPKCLFFTSDMLAVWLAEANWEYCLS